MNFINKNFCVSDRYSRRLLSITRFNSDGSRCRMSLRGREGPGLRSKVEQSGTGRNGPPKRVPDTRHAAEEKETIIEFSYSALNIRIGWHC